MPVLFCICLVRIVSISFPSASLCQRILLQISFTRWTMRERGCCASVCPRGVCGFQVATTILLSTAGQRYTLLLTCMWCVIVALLFREHRLRRGHYTAHCPLGFVPVHGEACITAGVCLAPPIMSVVRMHTHTHARTHTHTRNVSRQLCLHALTLAGYRMHGCI